MLNTHDSNFKKISSTDIFSSSSGGCSGDCSPPTLGLNVDQTRQLVEDGLIINGNSFAVDYFKQILDATTT